MRRNVRRLLHIIIRLGAIVAVEAGSLLLVDLIVPGIELSAASLPLRALSAVFVALIMSLINALIRPILVLITLPITILTFGFNTLIINSGMLLLAALFFPDFHVDGWGSAVLSAVLLAGLTTLFTSLIALSDEGSFYDGVVQWISSHRQMMPHDDSSRGLVILELDGVSYPKILRALDMGLMPTLQQMIDTGTHCLTHYDCGLPSQSSSTQAGIMYGDNFDIPAFRWFDKELGKMFVSNNFDDAYEINQRFSNGEGLLRGGTSINNLMSGDARKALFTMSMLTRGPKDVDRRSSEDLYLVFFNPYFFMRTLILTLWDVILEVFQASRQIALNIKPRVNRFHKGYPLMRALANIMLRDLSTYLVILNIMRGSPAIYTTYVGYDEISHYAGPDSWDAMHSLKGLDKQIRRIRNIIRRKAPRPYDLVLLSDHGQSHGATFRQRYGHTLAKFIEGLVRGEARVSEIEVTKNDQAYVRALVMEIEAIQDNIQMSPLRTATMGRVRRNLQSRIKAEPPAPAQMDTEVVVGVSGNLANVYFNLHAGKVSMQELNQAHPGLLEGLISHPGIGLVVAYEQDEDPWVFGKHGALSLKDGATRGKNPLLPYGQPKRHAGQLYRLAQFPHAGDLIVISTLFADGQVAAFEELIGSHGGLGGEQTDAFLVHPADMKIPRITNASELFPILNARRP